MNKEKELIDKLIDLAFADCFSILEQSVHRYELTD